MDYWSSLCSGCDNRSRNIHRGRCGHYRSKIPDGLMNGLIIIGIKRSMAEMKKEANEVMYKMAEYLLKKMQENGLINQEEREKIRTLNIETFSPELAKVYL